MSCGSLTVTARWKQRIVILYSGHDFESRKKVTLLKFNIFKSPQHVQGVHGGIVVTALRYKLAGRGFYSPMVSLEFFSDIILPVALWPWVRLSL
jgi:hypothetical protein